MKRFFLFIIFPFVGKAQFAPAAGQAGTTAIKKDSSVIVNWATGCTVVRGYQDISNPGMGFADVGDSSKAIGMADGVNVVSLGDGGSAVLTFQSPIQNLSGPDFCVFENSFDPGFLELAFVEVSSDGINFTRFPATSNNQNTVQIGPFDTSSDPAKINNLAGKYIGGFGVPFDLQELQGTSGLDINNITHVKIVDVVGCIQPLYARYDKNNNIINDPWATGFGSGGFDLDAVGVMHQIPLAVKEESELKNKVSLFPSVTNNNITVENPEGLTIKLSITDITGREVYEQEKTSDTVVVLNLQELEEGNYFVRIENEGSLFVKQVVKLNSW